MYFSDIDEIKTKIFISLSDREKWLYYFYTKEKPNDFIDRGSFIDKIIYFSFFDSSVDLSKEISQLIVEGRNSYKNDFLLLIALANYNFEKYEGDLKEFVKNCSLKENYIIHSRFQRIIIDTNKKLQDSIDKLLDLLLTEKNYLECSNNLYTTIKEIDGIVDLIVVEDIYKEIGKNYFPKTNEYGFLANNINNFDKAIEVFVKILFLIGIIFILRITSFDNLIENVPILSDLNFITEGLVGTFIQILGSILFKGKILDIIKNLIYKIFKIDRELVIKCKNDSIS